MIRRVLPALSAGAVRSGLLGGVLGALWGAGFVVASILVQHSSDVTRAIREGELAPVVLFPVGLGAVLGGLMAGGTAGLGVVFVQILPLSQGWRRAVAPIAAFALCLVVAPDFVIDPATVESHEFSEVLGRLLPFRVVPALIAATSVWLSTVRPQTRAADVN